MYTEYNLKKETIAGFQKIKEKDYWLNKLSGELLKTSIPYDYKGQPHENRSIGDGVGKSGRVTFTLSGDEFSKLMRMCSGADTRLQMVLIMILTVLLNKYTDHRDIIIATPIYRQKTEGEFINTVLAVRNRLQRNITFKELLFQVRQTLIEAVKHQEYPIRILLQDLKISYDSSREPFPLMDNAILVKNIQDKSYLRSVHPNIIYSFLRTDQALEGEIEYAAQLYERGTIRRIASHFIHLLKVALSDMDLQIPGVEMLTMGEKHQLLVEFNNTEAVYPGNKTIHELFSQQVDMTPDHIAAVGTNNAERKDVHITYRTLAIKSNQEARWLRKNSVTSESVVGIMMERSPSVIVVLLAILKAGAAYLPIEPGLPAERILYMLKESGAQTLLTHSRFLESIAFTSLRNFESHDSPGIVVTSPRQHIKDFNRLPLPDRSLIDLSRYKGKIGMASVTHCISLQATRGCPYECVFCHKVWSKKHVYRSAENIFSEVFYYYKKGVSNFAIIDDCFNLNRKNSTSFYQLLIKNKLNIKLFFPNGLRGDLLTLGDIDLMAAAGTRGINLSLETASPRLQKVIKKNLDIPRFKEIMDYIAAAHPNIILEIATMHGFPTETPEEAMMTLDFIKSIRWIHFPYIHILKIYPNTEMEKLALEQGISRKDIMASRTLAYHELPETLPFPRSFTRRYQSDFMNHYFLSKERLRQVLPVQMQILSQEALVQKYNTYLPVEIKTIDDLLGFTGLEDLEMPQSPGSISPGPSTPVPAPELGVPHIFDKKVLNRDRETGKKKEKAKRILLLDLSQHFSTHSMLYNVVEQPLGLISLLTYLEQQLGDEIDGRVYKAGIDFDGFHRLKHLVREYKPHLVGIRALTFYREFFHETASLLKQVVPGVPIIAGGPYATSDYHTLLQDRHIDLAVLGEGEYTLAELIRSMLKTDFNIPGPEILKQIHGIAFAQHKQDHTPDTSCDVILYDRVTDLISGQDPSDLNLPVSPRSLAYVMYTSGSTGKPRGVMVEHQPVNNCISWMQNKFHLIPNDIVIQRTNLTFDPSVWEIFWPLYVGGRVRVLSPEPARDAGYLIDLMTEPGSAAVMYCPSTLVVAMNYVLDKRAVKPRLKLPWLIIGAEPITMEAIKNFYCYYDGKIVNTYGPTEGTINNTWCDLPRDDSRPLVPIGSPVANNKIYILSRDLQLMPLKKAGEIGISGDSLARGYINNPVKTHLGFIDNPYGNDRLYRTGDIGKWWEDGTIEIMGRTDHQVKLRGQRIELGEIETALADIPGINDSVVVVRDSSQSARNKIAVCKWCGITSNYPGVSINEDGICEICENLDQYKKTLDEYFKTPAHLEKLIKEENKNKTSKYDCLLLYTGGRGAAFALYQLVEKGFNVLALTYDNGYFSKVDIKNIEKITTSVGVDHVVLQHKNSDQILAQGMKTASTVCRGCFHTSAALGAQYAYKNGIKVVVGATLSPGQIIENKVFMFLRQGITKPDQLEQEIAKIQAMAPRIDSDIFDYIDIAGITNRSIFKAVKAIDFYRYYNITNADMIAFLNNKNPYWKTRKTYAIYSTNCPIKQVGDYGHLLEKGYHYYGNATSWEKRLGHISLDNLEQDLQCKVTQKGYESFIKRINYTPKNKKSTGMKGKYLCAYIVSPGVLTVSELKKQLSAKLPEYMIPSYFVQLDKLPLFTNGKIDRKALPEPEIKKGADYVPPANETEQKLVHIWSEVLELKEENIGVTSDFFKMGGHSLGAMVLEAQMHKEFNIKISLVKIFEIPTIRGLAEYVKSTSKTGRIDVESVEKKEYYDLSLVQKRFYIQQQLYPENVSYSMPILFILEGNLEKDKLEHTFRKMIKRNENFRTSFEVLDDRPVQRVYDEVDFSIDYYEAGEQEINKLIEQLTRPFDLNTPPLMRIALIKLAEIKHLIKLDIHHIITDGITFGLFIKDFMAIYEGKKLPPLKLQYTDFSGWQSSEAQQEIIKKQGDYWFQQFKNGVPGIELSYDYPRPQIQRFEGDTVFFEISADETKQLRDMTQAEETSLYMVLFSFYFLLLWKLTGQEDIVVGTAVSGRRHTSLLNIMGLFFNTLPIRHRITRDKTFEEFLKDFKGTILESFENQDYPLDRLVEDLVEASLLSRNSPQNPLFDTMFSLQNFEILANNIPEIEIPGLKLIPYKFENKTSRFDLFFITSELDNRIEVAVEYATAIFKRSTIEKIARYYREIVTQVLEKRDIILKDITLPSEFLKVDNRIEKNELSNFGF